MQSILPRIKLLRYRVFLSVASAGVRLYQGTLAELSWLLGESIRERAAPAGAARRWRRALTPWDESGWARAMTGSGKRFPPWPDIHWPVETIFLFRPLKRFYGRGELLPFEIKLVGERADHSFFLECLLPALESLGYTRPSWRRRPGHLLWGHFDVRHIYVARGLRWEPLVQNGEVDLRVRPQPDQWMDGWPFDAPAGRSFSAIRWTRPFVTEDMVSRSRPGRLVPPSLSTLLAASVERLAGLLAAGDVAALWQELSPDEQTDLMDAVEQARSVAVFRHTLRAKRRLRGAPVNLEGEQVFAAQIPPSVIPYLELGSILHIGRYSHFGYGTFRLLE